MATQISSNLKSSTTRMIAAGVKTLHHLSLIAVALFLLVGAAQSQCAPGTSPCILVSDVGTHQVSVWPDGGGSTFITQNFLSGCNRGPSCANGAGGGEGVSCLAGNTNLMYLANNTEYINVFNLTTGVWTGYYADAGSGTAIAGLVANGTGSMLYAGQYASPPSILSLTPLPTSPYLMINTGQTTPDPTAGYVALGSGDCPPYSLDVPCSYEGSVFTAFFSQTNKGVNEYMVNPNLTQELPSLGQVLPGPLDGVHNCANFGTGVGTVCWTNLSGMAFDGSGNLWINQAETHGHDGTFEFAPGGTCGASPPGAVLLCPLNFTPDKAGSSADPIGVTVAPTTDPDNPGQILIANVDGNSVDKINPALCTGLNPPGSPWTPGNCNSGDTHPFIDFTLVPNARPKFAVYNVSCPNPANNGYVEICKQGNPEYPPPNQLYDFTATAPLFSSGTIQIPLGECSGAIEVPSGQVTVTEAPTIGVLVSDVTACSYNVFGECVPDLISWTQPDLFATVPVTQGGVSSETLTTFTNYAASPGGLKVCKIAGSNSLLDTFFNFTATGLPNFQVEAGPPDQGGYCQLVSTSLPVNTPETISEVDIPSGVSVSNITVTCNACTYSINLPQSSMTTTIGAGITVVSFTNTQSSKQKRCLACNNH
ncbi:MAG: hypothetical protein WBW69_19830 [Candidatus Korobacteraceae bacterium]